MNGKCLHGFETILHFEHFRIRGCDSHWADFALGRCMAAFGVTTTKSHLGAVTLKNNNSNVIKGTWELMKFWNLAIRTQSSNNQILIKYCTTAGYWAAHYCGSNACVYRTPFSADTSELSWPQHDGKSNCYMVIAPTMMIRHYNEDQSRRILFWKKILSATNNNIKEDDK